MFDESSNESSFNHPRNTKGSRRPRHAIKLSMLHLIKKVGRRKPDLQDKQLSNQTSLASDHPTPLIHDVNRKDLFFQTKVLSKVGLAVRRLKEMVVLSKPDFRCNEMRYIQADEKAEPSESSLLKFQSPFLTTLEVLFLLSSLITVWMWTFGLVFSHEFSLPLGFHLVLCSLLACEILVNFYSEKCHYNSQLVSEGAAVVRFYLANEFVFDLVATLGVSVLAILQQTGFDTDQPVPNVLKLLALLKFKSLERITSKLKFLYATTAARQTNFHICMLVCKLLFFIHSLSLLFNGVRRLEKAHGINITWVEHSELPYTSESDLYLYGWYWGSTILTTVGFGDITPGNKYEAMLVSFLEVLCCGIFGYCVNYIGALASVLGQSSNNFEKSMRRINQHLQNYKVDSRMISSIKTQLYNRHKLGEMYDPEAEEMVMQALPRLTREELLTQNNSAMLKKIAFFRKLSGQIVDGLAIKLRKVTYLPEEMVLRRGSGRVSLLMIGEGRVCDYFNNEPSNQERILTEYTASTNQLVGYVNFITGLSYDTSTRSKSFTIAYELCRDDFLEIVRPHQYHYSRFCEQKDKYILCKKRYAAGTDTKCQACQMVTHNVLQCPKIHYIAPSLHILLLRRRKQHKRCERKYHRRSNERINSKWFYVGINDDQVVVNSSSQDVHAPRPSNKMQKKSFLLACDSQGTQQRISVREPAGGVARSRKSIGEGGLYYTSVSASCVEEEEQCHVVPEFDRIKTTNLEEYFAKNSFDIVLADFAKFNRRSN